MPNESSSPTAADGTVANIQKNIRLVDTKLRVMTETLRQIANSGRNSTRDRRNARATLRFLDSLTTDTPNEKAHRPERAGGDVEMQNRAESARSGSVQRPG